MCKDFFSSQINESLLRSGIRRTNLFFGGRYLPDRVVSVVGGHDPWSPMGPRASDAHSRAPVHIVPGVSHCMAIGSTNSTNIEELESTKKQVLDEMYSFLMYGDLIQISAAVTARGSILLSVIAIFYFLI
ncbi:unnamed protein product [Arctia plantaginis]|uniref:Thymus-specific serine protease n=1 Tax=Arctia plantaginis TaxID=874455 RepID=A0A8S0ZWD3_ARCPL|nr:unnamed protein product [Arctia plantaginis]